MKFKRNIRSRFIQAIENNPAVLLTGARQTGKTTLAKNVAATNGYAYISFDDLPYLSAAKSDPQGFINNLQKPVILDEVQRVPEIFLPIKKDIDENRTSGRYILTGSANPFMIPEVVDSLVGRLQILEVYPLSQGELIGIKETFIDKIFANDFDFKIAKQSKREIFLRCLNGGYPSVQDKDMIAKDDWFKTYVTNLVYRDVNDFASVAQLTEFPRLLKILASRVGNMLNVSDISRTIGIPITTIQRYISILSNIFILDLEPAWHANIRRKFIKAPKVSMVDSGLLSYLIDTSLEKLEADKLLSGSIVEDFVVGELRKQKTWSKTRIALYHFRTTKSEEVDIILELSDGSIIAIEVKSGENLDAKDFETMKGLQEDMGKKFLKGIILYSGEYVIPFGKDLYAVPTPALWAP